MRMYLPVNERFISIQGEGKHTGRLSYFIRLQGCNLKCDWCDTKYTWGKKANEEIGVGQLAHDIVTMINTKKVGGVVFTGGEPLLYMNDIGHIMQLVVNIIEDRESLKDIFEIETNGLELYRDLHGFEQMLLMIVSPKLLSSGKNVPQLSYEKVQSILSDYTNCIFKFVVNVACDGILTGDSAKETREFITRMKIPGDKVWIMPQSLRREDQLHTIEDLVKWTIDNGWNFSLRAQNIIWDGKKGV